MTKLADFAAAAAEAAVDIAFRQHQQRIERHLNRQQLAQLVANAVYVAWAKLEAQEDRRG